MKALYIGVEFPEYYMMPCEVRESDVGYELDGEYEIRFLGESDWTDNIYSDEIEFISED